MRLSAARIRRWMLCAAPVMALCGLRRSAGGAGLGLALWLGLLLLRSEKYPYPRKRKTAPAAVAFSAALSACCMAGAFSLVCLILGKEAGFPLPSFLALTGAIGFSLPLGAWACRPGIPRKTAISGALLLCALFLLFIRM